MGESFRFEGLDWIAGGAVGDPGQRTFYLQLSHQHEVVTFKAEKQQMAALSAHLRNLLTDLPQPEVLTSPPVELQQPIEPQWAIGALGAAYDSADDAILLVAEEVQLADENGEAIEGDYGTATFRITRAQAAAFIAQADLAVAGGRPLCPWCARPIDLDGHACARMN